MRRILLLLLLASICAVGIANASPAPTVASLLKAARAQVSVPPEWDGIWTTVDTVYTCEGLFSGTLPPGADTLCGGTEYSNTDPNGTSFSCTGTANATTIDLTCTGSGEDPPGCTGDFTMTIHGTRTSTTFFNVYTIHGTYTGLTCPMPTACFQLNSHGTRTGATTAADCVTTPTKRSSWGELKILYR